MGKKKRILHSCCDDVRNMWQACMGVATSMSFLQHHTMLQWCNISLPRTCFLKCGACLLNVGGCCWCEFPPMCKDCSWHESPSTQHLVVTMQHHVAIAQCSIVLQQHIRCVRLFLLVVMKCCIITTHAMTIPNYNTWWQKKKKKGENKKIRKIRREQPHAQW